MTYILGRFNAQADAPQLTVLKPHREKRAIVEGQQAHFRSFQRRGAISELYATAKFTPIRRRKHREQLMDDTVLPPVTLNELTQLTRRAATVIEGCEGNVFAPNAEKRLEIRFNVRTAAKWSGERKRRSGMKPDGFDFARAGQG